MPLIILTEAVLPTVFTLRDAADFSITVSPYLYQLRQLPTQVLQALTSYEDLKGVYMSTNPLVSAIALMLVIAPLCLIVAEITGNSSQVDRLWPILPTLYNTHYVAWAWLHGIGMQRVGALWVCSAFWTVRLFYNYWRKGGYKVGEEDYRWRIVRTKMNRVQYFILEVLFIAFFQNILLLCITFPTYVLLLTSRVITYPQMALTDVIFSRFLLGLVLFEWFADQQQWNFQQAKKTYLNSAKVPSGFSASALDRGFVTSGLWAYSRHPNFLAEQSIWVVMYLWSCAITGTFVNWSIVGAVQYVALFSQSSRFSETVSTEKYPEYPEYKKRVGKFFPNLTGPGVSEWNKRDEEKKTQ